MSDIEGVCEGETCNRDGCTGILGRYEGDGCSCHTSPPCSDCVEAREYCPKCDWSAEDA